MSGFDFSPAFSSRIELVAGWILAGLQTGAAAAAFSAVWHLTGKTMG
jgi:hypothetical protein